MNADIVTLERLALKIQDDIARHPGGLSAPACLSVAEIIMASIGAPLNWPSRESGTKYADEIFSGSPAQRLSFNAGVKWTVENYTPSRDVKAR